MNRFPPPPINPSFQPSAPSFALTRSPKPELEDVRKFAAYLKVNIVRRPDLIPIVREAMATPLPTNWKEYTSDENEIYYYNKTLKQSTWAHPTDAFYRDLIKSKLEKRGCAIL